MSVQVLRDPEPTQQNNVMRTLEERLQITRIMLADNVPRMLEWKVFWTFLER